jgi:hypothetical protein
MMVGTLNELRKVRAAWRTLAPAAAALETLGSRHLAAAVAEINTTFGSARFAVLLACITCTTPTLVDVQIGDPNVAEPGAVVCGRCIAAIEADEANAAEDE